MQLLDSTKTLTLILTLNSLGAAMEKIPERPWSFTPDAIVKEFKTDLKKGLTEDEAKVDGHPNLNPSRSAVL